MRTRWILVAGACVAAAVVASGCGSKTSAPSVESKAETKSTNPDGSRATTTTESTQVGSTLVAKTESTEDSGKRKEKSVQETVVGTVTDYAVGKRIVILTGDGSKHDFDLADTKTTSTVDRRVTVGTKVQLDLSRDDSGNRSIRVVPAA